MSRKDGVTHKAVADAVGNSTSGKGRPRTTTKAATASPSSAKVGRPPPPPPTASPRAKMSRHELEQVVPKSSSYQTTGRRSGNKEHETVSSSSKTNVSSSDDQSIARTSIIFQGGPRTKALKQSEQRQYSSAPPLQAAAVNNRVKPYPPDRKSNGASPKSAVAGTPENKAVSNSRISRDSLAKRSSGNLKDAYLQKSGKELCKHCKSSTLESVCFISNDGGIAAIRTGASVRHLHVCNSPRCAANPDHKQSLNASKKILISQLRSLPSQLAKDKSSSLSCLGVRSVASSTNSSLHGDDRPRHSDAVHFQGKGENRAQESSYSGSTSAVDQNISGEDERSHNAETESHCGTSSTADQFGSDSFGLFPHNNIPSSTFVRELDDEQSCSVSIDESQDQRRSRHESGGLESGCCTSVGPENGVSSSFMRYFEDEQSCRGSTRGFETECSTPVLAHEISASIDVSKDQKTSRNEAGELESGCSTPVGPEHGGSSSFMRDCEDERSRGGSNEGVGSECSSPAQAHEKSASINGSQDQDQAGELESGCSTPIGQENGASSSFTLFEDERSCGGSNTGFGSECSTPVLVHEDSTPINKSRVRKSCKDEAGELESGCSTPFGYDNGDDDLSCSDDDKEATMRDGTISTLSASPGRHDFPNTSFEQSSNKLQRKRSSVSRMRRNYLNMLKEQEAETVRLRKQEIQKRKQAGDWMLDCAIEEVLHKLAPNGETRVKVLVEAFETVMTHSDSETQQHQ